MQHTDKPSKMIARSKSPFQLVWIARASFLIALFLASCTPPEEIRTPVEWVNPLMDSANSRWFFFSSACRPFGLVNLSPDMEIAGHYDSGYRYRSDSIRFFSHIHAWQMSGIPVMPLTGEFTGHRGSDAYKSHYTHENEKVHPGYHQVFLEKYNTNVELTSTKRVGFHRYTFPETDTAYVLFDLTTQLGPSGVGTARAKRVNETDLSGSALMLTTHLRPKDTPVYFYARTDCAFTAVHGWQKRKLIHNIDSIEGDSVGAYLAFSGNKNRVIQLKVAISYVSEAQAKINLETELAHWNFDQVVADSQEEWNTWLHAIDVQGGTSLQKERFYTDLWHALLGRRTVSDVNGKYADMTGAETVIRQIPLDENGVPLYNHHSSDSFWNCQWTLNTLWQLAYPKLTSDFCHWMLDYYDNGGLIPRGPSGGNYTFVMTSASTTPFLTAAYMKGIRDFDIDKAYEGMKKNALPGGLMAKSGYEHSTAVGGGLEHYIEHGYVPLGLVSEGFHHSEGAARTFEFAYQDWCLSELAKELNKPADYEQFRARAHNYRNQIDTAVGLARAREMDGSWQTPYNPWNTAPWVEGNAWQYTFFVPHDVMGLASMLGGKDKFNHKLNDMFEKAAKYDFIDSVHRYSTNNYVNYSNEPSASMAHLFNYSGAPWLSQKWARQVKDSLFSKVSPDYGYADDEDQGKLGSLSVLLSIGLFEVRGGAAQNPIYELTAPIFDRVTINLDSTYYPGKKFVIQSFNNSPENVYIQSAKLNGEPLDNCWMYHSDVVKGGKLELYLGPTPNQKWGVKNPPPSMTEKQLP